MSDLANALNGLGRFDEAEAHYRRAAALDQANANVRFNLGHALRAAGRPAEAAEWLRKALAIQAGHGPAHSELGRALLDLGQAGGGGGGVQAGGDGGRVGRERPFRSRQRAPRNRRAGGGGGQSAPRGRARPGACGGARQSRQRAAGPLPRGRGGGRLSPGHRLRPRARRGARQSRQRAEAPGPRRRGGGEPGARAEAEAGQRDLPGQSRHGPRGAGRCDAALVCFDRAAALRHGAPLAPDVLAQRGEERPAIPVAPFKLQHDAEQIRRLCGAGRIDESFGKIADAYEKILAALPADAPPEEPVALEAPDWRRIAAAYNRPLHLPEAPAAAGAPSIPTSTPPPSRAPIARARPIWWSSTIS